MSTTLHVLRISGRRESAAGLLEVRNQAGDVFHVHPIDTVDRFEEALTAGKWAMVVVDDKEAVLPLAQAVVLIRQHAPSLPILFPGNAPLESFLDGRFKNPSSAVRTKASEPPCAPGTTPLGGDLRSNRPRLETAIEHAWESVVITDVNATIEYVNPAFERLTGYTREEAVGKNVSLVKSGQHPQEFYRDLWNTILRGETWKGKFRNRRKDGSLFDEEGTISPICDPHTGVPRYFVAVKRDVTREIAVEAQMRQSQKLEAVRTLAGGIAHDFNNLLQAMLGYLELTREEVPPVDPVRGYLEEIEVAANRAAELVEQILAFSRQSSHHKRRPVRIQWIVREVMKVLKTSLSPRIAVWKHIDSRCGPVLAEVTEIHQVLMNLCSNAVHAMRDVESGTLEIELEQEEVIRSCLSTTRNLPPGVYARLTVRDSGHGMDGATCKRVFEPFFTTKSVDEGSGMGLAIVYGIVDSMGGGITVESLPNQGSTFTVHLPTARDLPPARAEDEPPPCSPASSEPIRVLLIDDEAIVRNQIRCGLERHGFQVIACHSGEAAWEKFRSHPEDFDFVVADHSMPGATGMEIAGKMLQRQPELPILLCTGFSDAIEPEIAAAAGIHDVVPKPCTASELAMIIRRRLGEKSSNP